MRVPLASAAFLVVWGNATALILGSTARLPGGSAAFALAGALLAIVALTVARADGQGARELLGRRRDALVGGAFGAAGASVLALGSLVFLRVVAPLVTGTPVEYAPLAGVAAPDLAIHAIVLLPLGIVIPEELAFRGTLLALALRRASRLMAVVTSAAAFALWHGVVIVATIGTTTLGRPSPWFLPACAIALAVVFAGGAAFALLRLRTRTIATTVAAHWAFNAVLLAGLWATPPLTVRSA